MRVYQDCKFWRPRTGPVPLDASVLGCIGVRAQCVVCSVCRATLFSGRKGFVHFVLIWLVQILKYINQRIQIMGLKVMEFSHGQKRCRI